MLPFLLLKKVSKTCEKQLTRVKISGMMVLSQGAKPKGVIKKYGRI